MKPGLILKSFIITVSAGVLLMINACGSGENRMTGQPVEIEGLTFTEREELQYADQFSIDRYEGGCSLIQTSDGAKYLIVPENYTPSGKLDRDIRIIRKPAEKIYLAATASMSLFDALGRGGNIRFSGTKAEDWHIAFARDAMNSGEMLYAGKYREPDYELLLSEGCTLSVQSTMILHTPEVREKLEELGITVFVDYSSYESHPLGRCEWIKVYGELMDQAALAGEIFEKQVEMLESIGNQPATGKTVAFFYISSSGQVVTRKSGDYVNKMITLAGGSNVFSHLDNGNGTSAVQMEMEKFYATAKDADFIIYNNNIGKDVHSIDDLIAKSSFLGDFKAVRSGNVWATSEDLFQDTMATGEIISDFHKVFSGKAESEPPAYLNKLKGGRAN